MSHPGDPVYSARPRRARAYTALGKIVVALAIGVLFGLAIYNSFESDRAKAARLTREQHAASFDSTVTELRHEGMDTSGTVAVAVMMVGILFAGYELLGFGVGWVVGRLAGPEPGDTPPSRPEGAA